jgi:hypothetical protein
MTDRKLLLLLLLHGTIEFCDGMELSLLSEYGDALTAIVPLGSNDKNFEICSCIPFVTERVQRYVTLFV